MADEVEKDQSTMDPTRNMNADSKNEVISTSESNPQSPETQLSDYQKGYQTFDTGLTSWLQVVGAFFCFFNSWYVCLERILSN